MNQIEEELSTCSMSKSCLVWSSAPGNILEQKSDTKKKQWWRTYGQDYPNATELHAFVAGTQYSDTDGSQPTDPVAGYAISQDSITTNADGYKVRTLKVVAYSTDRNVKLLQ